MIGAVKSICPTRAPRQARSRGKLERPCRSSRIRRARVRRRSRQRVTHGANGDVRCARRRKAVDAGRDCRKGDGGEALLDGEREAIAIAIGEQAVLAAFAAAPDWSYRVDDVARRQAEARRDLRLSGVAATELGASLGKLGSRGAMDGAADARRPALACVLAALTMASTSSVVMSPSTISMRSRMTLLETPAAPRSSPATPQAADSLRSPKPRTD